MAAVPVDASKARAAMRPLLHYLARGPAGIVAGAATPQSAVSLARAGERPRRFEAALLREAVALGLVNRRGSDVSLDAAGRSRLKRMLCADAGDSFGAQHRDRRRQSVEIESTRAVVTVNAAESPLAALMRLKQKDGQPFLGERAFQAGERLRADFTRGQLQPRISANWEASVASGSGRGGARIGDLTDAALAARMRVEKALETVGPELSGVLVDVCCFLKGLETVERERQWPVRSGKLMLKTALLALARHYEPPPRPDDRGRRSHRWGAEGYRPDFRLP